MMKSILTVVFLGAAIASAVPVEAQEVAGCRNAWNDLGTRGALDDARTLMATDCPVMYREGWLVNPNKRTTYVIPSCLAAWTALESRGSLMSVRFLVMHNCPVIQRSGWRSWSYRGSLVQAGAAQVQQADGGASIKLPAPQQAPIQLPPGYQRGSGIQPGTAPAPEHPTPYDQFMNARRPGEEQFDPEDIELANANFSSQGEAGERLKFLIEQRRRRLDQQRVR